MFPTLHLNCTVRTTSGMTLRHNKRWLTTKNYLFPILSLAQRTNGISCMLYVHSMSEALHIVYNTRSIIKLSFQIIFYVIVIVFKVFYITYHERSHIIYFFALPATCFYYCIYRRTSYLECRTGSSGRLGDWHSLAINIVITILTNRCWVHDIIFLFLARPQSKKFIWLVFGCLYVRLSLCLCMLTVISLLNALDACAAMKYSLHHGYIYIYRCHVFLSSNCLSVHEYASHYISGS